MLRVEASERVTVDKRGDFPNHRIGCASFTSHIYFSIMHLVMSVVNFAVCPYRGRCTA